MADYRDIWRWINEPARDTDPRRIPPRPVWRMFSRYFLRRSPGKLAAAVVVTCFMGLTPFVLSGAIKFLSDNILEVQLIEQQQRRGAFDPSQVQENRQFNLTGPRVVQGLGQQHETKPGKSVDQKLTLLAWLAAVLIVWQILQHIGQFFVFERTVAASQVQAYHMRQQIHDKLNALPLSYHDQYATGRLLTHLFSDVQSIQMTVCLLLRGVPQFAFAVVVGLAILFYLNAGMAWLAVVSLAIFGVGYFWFAGRQKAVSVNLREKEGLLIAHMASRVANFRLVKSFRRETAEAREFLRKATPNLQLRLASLALTVGLVGMWGLIGVFTMAAVVYFGVRQVQSGQMTAGEFLLFHGSMAGLFWPVAALTQQIGHYYTLRATSIKIMRVLDEPIDLASPAEPTALPVRPPRVVFENLSMRYAGSQAASLEELNFTIEPGKRLAVMGPSGAGKSTLARVAARLYDPTQGRITLDGVDLKQFRLTELRHYIGYVSQEPVVFAGSIADNIRYGSAAAGPGQVIAAAQYAQIHGYIETLPERYRTLTHERGLTLSGGQKQRMNLARALLANPRFIVLDDCTSALDAETEARLIEAFENALKDRTAMIVTHRVCVALSCDQVMMLDNGRVAEIGPPWKLLEQRGPFAELYRQQIGRLKLAQAS